MYVWVWMWVCNTHSVFATEVTPGEPGKKPVKIKLVDAKTREEIPDSPLYVDAALVCTGRVPNTQVCVCVSMHLYKHVGVPDVGWLCSRK